MENFSFSRFSDKWDSFFNELSGLGYQIRENKNKFHHPVLGLKNNIKWEISNYMGSVSLHLHSPFKTSRNFDFRNISSDDFEQVARDEILQTIKSFELDGFLKKLELQKEIGNKAFQLNRLSALELNKIDINRLSELNQLLDSTTIQS